MLETETGDQMGPENEEILCPKDQGQKAKSQCRWSCQDYQLRQKQKTKAADKTIIKTRQTKDC